MSPTENRNLKRILLLFTYPFIFLLRIIPRDRNIWMFGNFKGYMDNPKYLYEFLHNDKTSNIEIYWITKDKELFESLKSQGKRTLYYYSIKGFWKSFRAGVSFLANGYSDLNKIAALNSYIVHLWHGTPIKKIFFDAELENKFYSFGWFNNTMTYFGEVSTQFLNNKINLFLVSSDFELKRMSKAFRIGKEIFEITGVPRLDIIEGRENKSLNISNIFEEYNTTQGKNIVYAPTWRDKGWAADQILETPQKLIDLLEKENWYLFIKRHPLTKRKEIESWGIKEGHRIKFIGNSFDINGIYQFIDILITDFSSVMFDFGILKRPVLFFITDLEEYSKNRGFYDDIGQYSNGRINQSWEELMLALNDIDENQQFVNHPHYEYLLKNQFPMVREKIVELVNQKVKNAKNQNK